MSTQFTVWVYSPSMHQEQRCFTPGQEALTYEQALQQAQGFAANWNSQQNQRVSDWEPRVKEELVGVASLTNVTWLPGVTPN